MSISSEAATTRVCRICLGAKPPFVRPCACTGTIGDVHAACLERWVQEQGGVRCNVCKTDYATADSRKLRPLREWQRPSVDNALGWLFLLLLVPVLCFASVALILSMYFPSFLTLGDTALCMLISLCIFATVILTCFMGGVLCDCLRRQGAQDMDTTRTQRCYMLTIVALLLVAVSFVIASTTYYLRSSKWDKKKEEEHLRGLRWEVVTVSSLIYVILALTLLYIAYAICARYLDRQRRTDFIDATRLGVENQAVDNASNA